jgi:cytochrome P450
MREELPVYRNQGLGFFALSRYADVEAAHLDHETFSSAHGTVLELITPDPYPAAPMIFMDPPAHTMLRVLVSRAFTPRRVAALEDYVRKLCAELLDPQVAAGGFDYVQGFGAQLPSRVISELIGVDPRPCCKSRASRRPCGESRFETQSNGAHTISHLRSTRRVQACTDMPPRPQVLADAAHPVGRAGWWPRLVASSA